MLRGGAEAGYTGVSDGGTQRQPAEEQSEFAGMGPLLEDDDTEVFKDTEALIRRQELLATNRWNQDEYYKCVVDGYPWATLTHDTDRDVYTFELPYGVSQLSIQPIPNKNLDLVNGTSEQLLVDFPEADAQPMDDSEEAEHAAEAADRFLAQELGEQGSNAAVLYDDRVKLALVCATAYIERWMDPSGGGYVPLQIEAHPLAVSPDNPLVGPDGMPTTDYVLRYVTAPEGGEFTDDPTLAAPQWQPKMRASKWAREHIRTVPENCPVELAKEAVILGYCTLGEAKDRWPSVEAMAPEDLSALCDWTPPLFTRLLPLFQRARWRLDDGKTKNKSGASDERIMFYYHRYVKARPLYPKGADVVMSGVDGGLVIDRKVLSVEVEVSKGGDEKVKETRCREIPVIGITPRGDPYGQDPTGRAYINLFVGATEHNSVLAQGFSDGMRKILTTPFASTSLSAIQGWQIEEARRTGDILKVLRIEDIPKQLNPPVMPAEFFRMFELSDDAINRIARQTKAASGEIEGNKDPSGKAIQLTVAQNNIGSSSMLTAVNNAFARDCRIILEIMMSECTTAQQVAYVGEDGANKMMDLHATDFALIGKVGIKAGTGTGLTQDGKVQYLGNLTANGFVDLSEARESARPSFARRLGLPANPFEQYVSRCIDAWLEGPPAPQEPDPNTPPQLDAAGQPITPPTWQQQYRAWMDAQAVFEQQQAQFQATQQANLAAKQNAAIVQVGDSEPATPKTDGTSAPDPKIQQAKVGLAMNPPGPDLPPPQPPMVPKPWTPFDPRPNDTEPELAEIWNRKMSRTMSTVKYGQFKATQPEWTDCFDRQYTLTRQARAMGQTAQVTVGGGKRPPPQQGQPGGGTPPVQPSQPTQPSNLPAGA